MKKHSIELYGHKTSFSLKDEFWQELKAIALQENTSLAQLIGQIDASRHSNLSSALRVFILNKLKEKLK